MNRDSPRSPELDQFELMKSMSKESLQKHQLTDDLKKYYLDKGLVDLKKFKQMQAQKMSKIQRK